MIDDHKLVTAPSLIHTANVFLPGCLGPVKREVVLIEDHQELVARLEHAAHERDQLKAENEALRNQTSCVDDLSALVRQLVQRLRKAAPDNDLSEKALDYLKRKGLLGSPMRAGQESETPDSPPLKCRQRLAADGKPFPRSSCEVCGQFSPKWRECDAQIAAMSKELMP